MAPQQIEIDTIGGQWLATGYYWCHAQSRTCLLAAVTRWSLQLTWLDR